PGLHVIDTGPIRPGSLDPKRPARRLAARPDGAEVGRKHRRLAVGRDPGASDARAADRAEGSAHDVPRVVLADDRYSRAAAAERWTALVHSASGAGGCGMSPSFNIARYQACEATRSTTYQSR